MDKNSFSVIFTEWLLSYIGYYKPFRNKSHVAKVLGSRTARIFELLNSSAHVSLFEFIKILMHIDKYSGETAFQAFDKLLTMFISRSRNNT